MTSIRSETLPGRRVALTHADSPIGRRLVKSLYHDPSIERIVAVGSGAPPRCFERFLNSDAGRLTYDRVNLARQRSISTFFNSSRLREARIDSLVYVPAHSAPTTSDLPVAGESETESDETQLLMRHVLEMRGLENLICLGSALVYRLSPGNSNLFTESSELELAADTSPEIRRWINSDMIFQREFRNPALRVALLRVPTVIGTDGTPFFNSILTSALKSRLRPMGFDPICALVSDKDVVRALQLALHSTAQGIFNIAGFETIPISVLARWTGAPGVPLPSSLIALASYLPNRLAGTSSATNAAATHLRYGFTLDTHRARRELGFEPSYRIAPSPAEDGRILMESAPV